MEPFPIGGVGGTDVDGNSETGCLVTHVITYFTPMKAHNRQVFLTVALALVDKCATNTIVGLPFMLMSGLNLLLPSMTAVADNLGLTFPLRLRSPGLSHGAPEPLEDGPVALHVDPTAEYHTVGNEGQVVKLTKILNALATNDPAHSDAALSKAPTPIRWNPLVPIHPTAAFAAAAAGLHYTPGLHVLPKLPEVAKSLRRTLTPMTPLSNELARPAPARALRRRRMPNPPPASMTTTCPHPLAEATRYSRSSLTRSLTI